MQEENPINKAINNNNQINNGIIRLYHHFPHFYENFNSMTEQLPHIRHNLQCNAVWLGPIQEAGKKKVRRRNKTVWGSQYAMLNHEKFDARLGINHEKLKQYTKECERLGLTPLFDLVLNQIAADDNSPILNLLGKKNFYEKKIGNGKSLWDDTLWFNYSDADFAEKVINEFWKPFIRTYIVEYGFRGVRIDAVKYIATDTPLILRNICNFVRDCCHKVGAEPIILAELLDENPTGYAEVLKKDFGFTHILNSTFSSDYSKQAREKGYWNSGDWLLREIGTLQSVIYDSDEKRRKLGIGGTIGYVGNHDKLALGNAIETLIKQKATTSTDKVECAKEFIYGVAYTSDAGWYIFSGDEYYPKSKSTEDNIVFSNCPTLKWEQISSNDTLCLFIGAVNYSLSKLAATAFNY